MKVIFLFFLSLPHNTFAIDVVLATGVNTDPPYVYGDEVIDAEHPGITIEVLKLIEARSEINFIIKKMPWSRVVHSVKKNELDGGFHFSFKPDRVSFVSYPTNMNEDEYLPDSHFSLYSESYYLYRLIDYSAAWRDKNRKLVVGVIRGSSVSSLLVELGYELKEVSHDRQLARLLLSGRIDAYAGLQNMHDAKLKQMEPEQRSLIEKVHPELSQKPYYIGFSKHFYRNHKDVAWSIWNIIADIKLSGELDDLYLKYASE